MRVETREAADTMSAARLEPDLSQVRSAATGASSASVRPSSRRRRLAQRRRAAARASAATAARSRGSAGAPTRCGRVVEGTAYGAYDPGPVQAAATASGRELTLVVDAPAELHELAQRQAVVARHLDAARDLANRPPNELTPAALADHAQGLAPATTWRSRRTGASGSRRTAWARSPPSRAGSAHDPQLICMRYDPPNARGDVTSASSARRSRSTRAASR